MCEPIRKRVHTQLVREHSATVVSTSQLVEPLWTDPGLKSGISVRDLISSVGEGGSAGGGAQAGEAGRRGMNCRTFSQNPRTRGKKIPSYILCSFFEEEVKDSNFYTISFVPLSAAG